MQDLALAILAVVGVPFLIYALASSMASGGRKSTKDSLSEAAEETKNNVPSALFWVLVICGLLLLSGTIAR